MDFNIRDYVWYIDQLHHINTLPPARGMTLRRHFGFRTGLSSMDASWCIVERKFSTDAPTSLVPIIITCSSIFTVMSSENFWSAVDFSTSRYTGAWIQEDNGSEITSFPFKSAWYGYYTFLKSSIVRWPGNWDSVRNVDPWSIWVKHSGNIRSMSKGSAWK